MRRNQGSTLPADLASRRGREADEPLGLVLDYAGVGTRSRPKMRVHITAQPGDDKTVCVVEGAIDALAAAQLAEALEVALRIEPRNAVLLDLTHVDWMALLDVRTMIDKVRRVHAPRRIVVRHATGHEQEAVTPIAPETADGSRGALTQAGEDSVTSDVMRRSSMG